VDTETKSIELPDEFEIEPRGDGWVVTENGPVVGEIEMSPGGFYSYSANSLEGEGLYQYLRDAALAVVNATLDRHARHAAEQDLCAIPEDVANYNTVQDAAARLRERLDRGSHHEVILRYRECLAGWIADARKDEGIRAEVATEVDPIDVERFGREGAREVTLTREANDLLVDDNVAEAIEALYAAGLVALADTVRDREELHDALERRQSTLDGVREQRDTAQDAFAKLRRADATVKDDCAAAGRILEGLGCPQLGEIVGDVARVTSVEEAVREADRDVGNLELERAAERLRGVDLAGLAGAIDGWVEWQAHADDWREKALSYGARLDDLEEVAFESTSVDDHNHECESVTTADGHGAYCAHCGETLA
jgi:hypothetical protein